MMISINLGDDCERCYDVFDGWMKGWMDRWMLFITTDLIMSLTSSLHRFAVSDRHGFTSTRQPLLPRWRECVHK